MMRHAAVNDSVIAIRKAKAVLDRLETCGLIVLTQLDVEMSQEETRIAVAFNKQLNDLVNGWSNQMKRML